MAIHIGGINLANEIIELHYQMMRTQSILEWIIAHNPHVARPRPEQFAEIDEAAVKALQAKFPDAGITRTEKR